jgi:hypothetical protein
VIRLLVLDGSAWFVYRPRLEQSPRYQASVVPPATIRDVEWRWPPASSWRTASVPDPARPGDHGHGVHQRDRCRGDCLAGLRFLVIQSLIAIVLAYRAKAWRGAVGFPAIALMMAGITVLGLPI